MKPRQTAPEHVFSITIKHITWRIESHIIKSINSIARKNLCPKKSTVDPLTMQGLRFAQPKHVPGTMLSPLQALSYLIKQRHYFANKGPSSQGYGFSCGHVWM